MEELEEHRHYYQHGKYYYAVESRGSVKLFQLNYGDLLLLLKRNDTSATVSSSNRHHHLARPFERPARLLGIQWKVSEVEKKKITLEMNTRVLRFAKILAQSVRGTLEKHIEYDYDDDHTCNKEVESSKDINWRFDLKKLEVVPRNSIVQNTLNVSYKLSFGYQSRIDKDGLFDSDFKTDRSVSEGLEFLRKSSEFIFQNSKNGAIMVSDQVMKLLSWTYDQAKEIPNAFDLHFNATRCSKRWNKLIDAASSINISTTVLFNKIFEEICSPKKSKVTMFFSKSFLNAKKNGKRWLSNITTSCGNIRDSIPYISNISSTVLDAAGRAIKSTNILAGIKAGENFDVILNSTKSLATHAASNLKNNAAISLRFIRRIPKSASYALMASTKVVKAGFIAAKLAVKMVGGIYTGLRQIVKHTGDPKSIKKDVDFILWMFGLGYDN